MEFKPVNIATIHDVLPHITDKPEIVHLIKSDYSVLDYVYSSKDTFDNGFAQECRGLKFDKQGKIIARPYHKFHNLDENEAYSSRNVNLSLGHDKLDKLDGSMCHSCRLNGNWRLMTRKGESEVALKAMAFLEGDKALGKRYYELFDALGDFTLMFEYVAPHNRIVIPYKKEELILTGIRHITSGQYTSYDVMVSLAKAYGIPVVGTYNNPDYRTDKDKEGCIIRFHSGSMIKMKSDIYVRKHRSKDLVSKFKDLVALIVDDDLDDVLPQLDEKTRDKVTKYAEELLARVNVLAKEMDSWVDMNSELEQKEYASMVKNHVPAKPMQTVAFQARKTGDAFEEYKRCIRKAYGDTTRLTDLFEELELPQWVGDFFSE